MKKVTTIIAALFLIAFSANLMAQVNQSSIDDVPASATIITPILLSQIDGLDFGNIIAGAGTVVWDPIAQTRTSTGDVTLQPAVPGQLASFEVSGLGSASYVITLPTTAVIITNGNEDMEITNFLHNAGTAPTLDAAGNAAFRVGATLNVGANQDEGLYSGQFPVTVAYQ